MLQPMVIVQTEGDARAVLIPDSLLVHLHADLATFLRAHGIDPDQPYTYEELLMSGSVARRYIQPPRHALKGTAT